MRERASARMRSIAMAQRSQRFRVVSMDEIREFARRYTAAWCSGDPASVAAHYAPDGSLTINDGEPSVGRDAITEAAQGGRGAQRRQLLGEAPRARLVELLRPTRRDPLVGGFVEDVLAIDGRAARAAEGADRDARHRRAPRRPPAGTGARTRSPCSPRRPRRRRALPGRT